MNAKRNWLALIRGEMQMGQQEVAEKCGIGRSTYTLIESGQRRPSVEVAKAIASVLGFSWTRFYDEESEEISKEVS